MFGKASHSQLSLKVSNQDPSEPNSKFHDESRGVARTEQQAALASPLPLSFEVVHLKDGDSIDGRAGADREASCTGLRSQEAQLQ